jgi:hypothetical protein
VTRLALDTLDTALQHLAGTRLDPLQLVLDATLLQQGFGSGISLQEFLTAAVAHADEPLDVFVTGHSKGGALSSTVALWLADTQGADVGAAERWDPEHKAIVHAYSFAGPTAGNRLFAAHSDDVIGDRCHRTLNLLDVVPHAFAVADLKSVVPRLHRPTAEAAQLDGLVDGLAAAVDAATYTQVGRHVERLRAAPDSNRSLVDEVIHQHLAGYLEEMQLSDEMSVFTFFDPLT